LDIDSHADIIHCQHEETDPYRRRIMTDAIGTPGNTPDDRENGQIPGQCGCGGQTWMMNGGWQCEECGAFYDESDANETDKTTPRPWIVACINEIHDHRAKFDSSGARIGDTPNRIAKIEYPYANEDEQEANAVLIVRAVNCHDSLVEACEQISEWYELVKRNYPDMAGLLRGMDLARAALEAAKD